VSVRPGWIAGVAALVVLVYIGWNTLHTKGQGSAGLPAGAMLPPFAAPLATSSLDGDANLFTHPTGRFPAACDVRRADVLNSCRLTRRGPVVIAFLTVSSKLCENQFTTLDRLRSRFPRVGFAGVAIKGDQAAVRAAVARNGWRIPVAWDRDGAIANAYAVAVCPTIVLARRGGRVVRSLVGERSAAALSREIAAL
jgi:AhpC/TSA family